LEWGDLKGIKLIRVVHWPRTLVGINEKEA